MSDLIRGHLKAVLEDFGDTLVKRYKEALINANKVASGNLINSLKYEIVEEDDEVKILLYYADYGYYVDQGRFPTKNSGSGELQRKIEDWIRVKGITPRPDSKGKLPTIKQLSFLISRKIHQEGYKSTPILADLVESLYILYQHKIQEAVEDDYSELVLTKVEYLLGNLFK